MSLPLPAPLSLLWTCEGGRALERAVHVRLAAYRTRGEWFDLTALGDPVDAVRAAVKAVHADARAAARSAKRAAARREQLDADPERREGRVRQARPRGDHPVAVVPRERR
ncbi:GIY-YIG nuclease family protein [Streptomyces sp. NPDC058412]|uniref:GIY-YIG nuclease family protein n=1 Tax=Streptomyces sp. NPDC058412 TaxID=3346486 RepID=UPI003662E29E